MPALERGLPSGARSAFQNWWKGIGSEDASGQWRADRAELKRAHDLIAVTGRPAYHRIYRRMAAASAEASQGWSPWQKDRIAAAVALAAHVPFGGDRSLPKSFRLESEPVARVSPLRFRRLLEASDVEALFVGVRRLLPLARDLDAVQLADDVFRWGDAVRRNWAYDYDWPDDPAG